MTEYPRDLVGYGPKPPKVKWPGGARVALQFVLNYEEGGENSILHGDKASEAFLSEIVGAQPLEGARHMSMESIYEYGSRVGVWRLLELFERHEMPLTVFGVAMAMERNPAAVEAFLKAGHEIASHGWRWINYQHVPLEVEREHMQRAIEIHRKLTGERPLGWYTGRTSPNTRRLVVEDGGFVYDADDYNDDIPWYDTALRQAAARRALHARRERHALRHRAGLQFGRRVLQLPEGQLRRALRRGQLHDVGRPALPPGRPARPHGLARALHQVREKQDACGSRAASTSRATGSSTIPMIERRSIRRSAC